MHGFWVSLVLAAACTESLDPASLITRLRAVAAVTQVVGDEMRANPASGEDVRVTVHLATPGPRPEIAWRFFACVPAPTRFGVPFCDEAQPLIEPIVCEGGSPAADGGCEGLSATEDPVVRFTVPDADALGNADEVLLIGAMCGRGTAATPLTLAAALESDEPTLNGCADGDPDTDGNGVDELSTVLFSTIPLRINGDANQNPSPISLSVLNDSTPELVSWVYEAPRDAPVNGCTATTAPQRATSAGFPRIQVELLASSLEDFEQNGETVTEEMQISWLATGVAEDDDSGEFENPFSFISERGSDASVTSALFYEPPRDPDATGTLVRYHFVVRDGRGGTVWAERALCFTP